MSYFQFSPDYALTNYIDAYWYAKGDKNELTTEKILPDGCVDIIFNLGENHKADDNGFIMKNEGVYLVGTMTRFKNTITTSETDLLGIRFKPAAFSAFYEFDSLHEVTDQKIELDKEFLPDFQKIMEDSVLSLNQFFLNKLSKPNHNLFQVINDILKHKGQISLQVLALSHFTTIRQLERGFKNHVGISPKEFINLVRYQFAVSTIKSKSANQSLLDIALECGYYDHSHLTNEVKRYTGVLPSQF
jgi:AraC-like DNA-binding protein